MFAAQKTLVEAWSIVEDAYVDGRFGGHNWEEELSDALVAAYGASSGDTAYAQIGHMLEKLGDPFTRIVPASCALCLSRCLPYAHLPDARLRCMQHASHPRHLVSHLLVCKRPAHSRPVMMACLPRR